MAVSVRDGWLRRGGHNAANGNAIALGGKKIGRPIKAVRGRIAEKYAQKYVSLQAQVEIGRQWHGTV
jgi:hypothetical protein